MISGIESAAGGAEFFDEIGFEELTQVVAQGALVDGHKAAADLVKGKVSVVLDEMVDFLTSREEVVDG